MKVVAQYVMRGRLQALWVALVGASLMLLTWVSAAVVALVTLRRGPAEGGLLLALAVLPAAFMLTRTGDVGPLNMLVGTGVLALVLRWAVSWQLTLLTAVAVGLGTGFTLLWFGEALLERYAELLGRLFEDLQARLPEGQLQVPELSTIAGTLGFMNALSCVMCLLLARYWQSALYNPGGFREELHGLRLAAPLAIALLSILLGLSFVGIEYRPWAVLFALPLSIAGLGYIHAHAARRGLGTGWLGLFYLLWLLLDLVKLVVIGIAIADSLFDLRGRWRGGGKGRQIQ